MEKNKQKESIKIGFPPGTLKEFLSKIPFSRNPFTNTLSNWFSSLFKIFSWTLSVFFKRIICVFFICINFISFFSKSVPYLWHPNLHIVSTLFLLSLSFKHYYFPVFQIVFIFMGFEEENSFVPKLPPPPPSQEFLEFSFCFYTL